MMAQAAVQSSAVANVWKFGSVTSPKRCGLSGHPGMAGQRRALPLPARPIRSQQPGPGDCDLDRSE